MEPREPQTQTQRETLYTMFRETSPSGPYRSVSQRPLAGLGVRGHATHTLTTEKTFCVHKAHRRTVRRDTMSERGGNKKNKKLRQNCSEWLLLKISAEGGKEGGGWGGEKRGRERRKREKGNRPFTTLKRKKLWSEREKIFTQGISSGSLCACRALLPWLHFKAQVAQLELPPGQA